MKHAYAFAVVVMLATTGVRGGENEWLAPLGMPPRAAPRHISGGESLPPLPLPATPLRRTERKRDPAPPTLIGKVVLHENVWIGLDTVISPGVEIGKNSFVRSKSIVLKSFEENSYISGDPATRQRDRFSRKDAQ